MDNVKGIFSYEVDPIKKMKKIKQRGNIPLYSLIINELYMMLDEFLSGSRYIVCQYPYTMPLFDLVLGQEPDHDSRPAKLRAYDDV